MGFPTRHQTRFYAALNFLKMGINYLNLSSLRLSFDNIGREVCCKVSLYKNCQRQCCCTINCLSSGINILVRDRKRRRPLPPEILAQADLPLLIAVKVQLCRIGSRTRAFQQAINQGSTHP